MGQLSHVKALDVLPYHTLGVHKYRDMGMTYSLDHVRPATKQDAQRAKQAILQAYRQTKKQ